MHFKMHENIGKGAINVADCQKRNCVEQRNNEISSLTMDDVSNIKFIGSALCHFALAVCLLQAPF